VHFGNTKAALRILGLRSAIGLNLNEPFGIDDTLHLNKGARWPDCGEKFRRGRKLRLPTAKYRST
jgi:hypothetical protein